MKFNLKKWRERNNYTQSDMITLIRVLSDLNIPLRTYQRIESSNDHRLLPVIRFFLKEYDERC